MKYRTQVEAIKRSIESQYGNGFNKFGPEMRRDIIAGQVAHQVWCYADKPVDPKFMRDIYDETVKAMGAEG